MNLHDEDVFHTAKAVPDRATMPAVHESPGASSSAESRVAHLQRTIGNAGVVQLLQSDDDPHGLAGLVGGSGGSSLDAGTRVQMESAIGADFSDVRIHTGGEADQSAKSLGAHAYTTGNDVVFADGQYDPGSESGQRTLAHELTHVVQQRSGPVDGTMTDTGVSVSDPSDSFEQAAVANADRVVSGGAPDIQPTTAGGSAGPSVQRHGDEAAGDDDGGSLQMLAVQREEAPEEEEMPS